MTYIEVVDSAVKIGLGAIITGVITVIHNIQKRNLEKEKYLIEKKHKCIDQIVLNVQEISYNLTKSTHQFWLNSGIGRGKNDYEEAAKIFLGVKELVIKSRCLSVLIQFDGVSVKFDKLEGLSHKLYEASVYGSIDEKAEKLNEYMEEITILLDGVLEELSKMYD